MKTRFLGLAAVVLLLTGFIACNENDEIDMDFSNIEKLCEQPTSVIEKAIRGKWRVVYYQGGLVSMTIQSTGGEFVEFTSGRKYRMITPRETFTVKFDWEKVASYYTVGNSMHVMKLSSGYGIPTIPEKIHNDTLILDFYQVMDARKYYCVKTD